MQTDNESILILATLDKSNEGGINFNFECCTDKRVGDDQVLLVSSLQLNWVQINSIITMEEIHSPHFLGLYRFIGS